MTKAKERRTLDFDNLNGNVLVSKTEEFEVAVTSFTGFGVTIDFDTEVVSVRLPVEFTLRTLPAYQTSPHK
jgi:hypothetical protein